jgi:SAM-dependent methyltransferase
MDARTRFYPETRFGGFSDVDGTLRFYVRVRGLITPGESTVLDIGCGRGERFLSQPRIVRETCSFKGYARHVLGIDVDPAAATNPSLDAFSLIDGPRWPADDQSINLCVSDYVLEHVEHPDAFVAEVRRVLRPGGYFCFRTPNAWGYVPLVARMIPDSLHHKVLGKAQPHRAHQDVFPTYYRANSRRRLRRLLGDAGFESCIYSTEAEPAYFGFSPIAYAAAYYVHHWLPSPLRSTLLGFARKTTPAS